MLAWCRVLRVLASLLLPGRDGAVRWWYEVVDDAAPLGDPRPVDVLAVAPAVERPVNPDQIRTRIQN